MQQQLKINMNEKKFKFDLLILALSAILTILLYLKTDVMNYSHEHFQQPWDHHKYIWMANHNLGFHIAPFCWRIFVPFLASILPFELLINFKLITLISVTLTGFLVYKIGSLIFADKILSLSIMLAYFSISWATKFVIYDFWLPDAFAILLMTAGIYSILKKNDFVFLILMVIGALTKESVLFVLPLFYSLRAKEFFDYQIFKRTILISIIPLLTLFIVRLSIPALNANPEYVQSLPDELRIVQLDSAEYNLNFLLENVALKKLENLNLHFFFRITVYTFLVYFVLCLFDFTSLMKWLIRFLPFIILSYLQIFVAINEERLVAIAFLPILIFSISGMNKIFETLPYKNFSLIFLNTIFFLMVLNSGLFYGVWLIIRQISIVLIYWVVLFMISKFRKTTERK